MPVPNSGLRNPNLTVRHLSKTVHFPWCWWIVDPKLLVASSCGEEAANADTGF